METPRESFSSSLVSTSGTVCKINEFEYDKLILHSAYDCDAFCLIILYVYRKHKVWKTEWILSVGLDVFKQESDLAEDNGVIDRIKNNNVCF